MNKTVLFLVFWITIPFLMFAQTSQHFQYEQALISNNTRCISQNIDGSEIWVGTTEGVSVYNGTNWTNYTTNDNLPHNLIYDIHCASNGDMWVATGSGIAKFDNGNWTAYTMGDGLPASAIWSITEDTDGNIWGGTSNSGIFKYNGNTFYTYSTQNGLIDNSVKSIYGDKYGYIWVGTGAGLSRYDGNTFKNYNNTNGLGGNLVNDILQLSNGSIAVATNGGLSIFNFASWQTLNTSDGLPNNNVLSIAENDANVLYIGCANGLFEYENSTTYSLYNIDDGLAETIVSSVLVDKTGSVWAGAPFSGISRYHKNNKTVIFQENTTIASNNIKHIYKDNNAAIWISTDNGLNSYENNQWRTYKTAYGIADNSTTCTFQDASDNIWVGTNNGLSKIDAGTVNNFTTDNGLSNNTINAVCADNDNKIYVATNNQVNIIQDNEVISNIGTSDGLASNIIYNVFFDNDLRLWIATENGLMFLENDELIDANTIENFEIGKALAIANNSNGGIVMGTDEYLYFYPDGTNGAYATPHPLATQNSAITSISEYENEFYCSFENGEYHKFDGTNWTEITTDYPVSYSYIDPNGFTWLAYFADGLDKICRTCTQNIDYNLSDYSCVNQDYALTNLSITNPSGTSYSIDGGQNFQNDNTFNNIYPGYYDIIVKNGSEIIALDNIFVEGIGGIKSCILISQIDCFGNDNAWIELLDIAVSESFIWNDANTTDFYKENLSADTYSITVQNIYGCIKELENTIEEPEELQYSLLTENLDCYEDETGKIEVSVEGGMLPYSINWSDSNYEGLNLDNMPAGNYQFTLTDNNECQVSGSANISQPAPLIIDGTGEELDCFGDAGNITVSISGGTTPYEYLWSDGNTELNRTNIPVGSYTITVTDLHNCTISGTWEITQPTSSPSITNINKTDVLCYGESTGSITPTIEGGTPPYSYLWTVDTQEYSEDLVLTDLPIGDYNLLVTDDNGCVTSANVEINQSDELNLSIEATNITCPGYANGSLFANVSGGTGIYSSYYWYDEDDFVIGVQQTLSNLGPGTYTVVVTDSYYCTITDTYTLSEGIGHQIDFDITDVSCNGASNGSVNVIVNGSTTGDYSYSWAGDIADNTNAVNNLQAGSYPLTVTDFEGCQTPAVAIVEQPPIENLGAFPENGEYRFCSGDELILDAGPGFVSYLWTNGASTQTIPVVNGGSYAVLVRDQNNCLLADTATVIVGEVHQGEELNLVSVNSNNQTTLYWERTLDVGTDHYNIYRKSGNQYILHDTHNAELPGIYTDLNSDASQNAYSYKIAAVDTCGNEAELSDKFSSIWLEVHSSHFNQQSICTLNYTPNDGFFVVYYYILKGTSPDNLQVVDENLYDEFSYIEFNPNEEGTYYQIMVRRLDGCYPGDGNYYDTAYSNIVFCQPYTFAIAENLNDRINIYPSPFDNYLNIKFDLQESSEVHIYLINTLGQAIVYEDNYYINTGYQEININPNIPSGMYMLKLKVGDNWISRKIIKN